MTADLEGRPLCRPSADAAARRPYLFRHRDLDVGEANDLVFEMMLSGKINPAELLIFLPRAVHGRVRLWNVIPGVHAFGLWIDIQHVLVGRGKADLVET